MRSTKALIITGLAVGSVAIAGCGGSSSAPSAATIAAVCPQTVTLTAQFSSQSNTLSNDSTASNENYGSWGSDAQAMADTTNLLAADATKLGESPQAAVLHTLAGDLIKLGRDADNLNITGLANDAQSIRADMDQIKALGSGSSAKHYCKGYTASTPRPASKPITSASTTVTQTVTQTVPATTTTQTATQAVKPIVSDVCPSSGPDAGYVSVNGKQVPCVPPAGTS